MRRMILATAVALTTIGALPSASAQSNTFTVDCNRGQKIATALEQGDFRKPVVINLRGTCREFVTITRAGVTLRGDPAAEIVAPDNARDLLTISADRATLENLTLTGGLTGLSQDHQPSFYAQNVVVQDTSGIGVRVRVGDARLNGFTVQRSGGVGVYVVRGGSLIMGALNLGNGQLLHSQVLASGGAGLSARSNSVVNLNGVTVMGSKAQGVLLSENSQGTISNVTTGSGEIIPSTISDNTLNGVELLSDSQATVSGSDISSNGGAGVYMERSEVEITRSSIEHNGKNPSANARSGVAGSMSRVSIGYSTIADHPQFGVGLNVGSSLNLDSSSVTGSGQDGVSLYLGVNANLNNSKISGNAANGLAMLGSTAQLSAGAEILNNGYSGVMLMTAAKLWLISAPVTVGGNDRYGVYCHDAESSVADLAFVTFWPANEWEDVSPGCTGF